MNGGRSNAWGGFHVHRTTLPQCCDATVKFGVPAAAQMQQIDMKPARSAGDFAPVALRKTFRDYRCGTLVDCVD
jgi:hypothetical protein